MIIIGVFIYFAIGMILEEIYGPHPGDYEYYQNATYLGWLFFWPLVVLIASIDYAIDILFN